MLFKDLFESKSEVGKCFLILLNPSASEPIIWEN